MIRHNLKRKLVEAIDNFFKGEMNSYAQEYMCVYDGENFSIQKVAMTESDHTLLTDLLTYMRPSYDMAKESDDYYYTQTFCRCEQYYDDGQSYFDLNNLAADGFIDKIIG